MYPNDLGERHGIHTETPEPSTKDGKEGEMDMTPCTVAVCTAKVKTVGSWGVWTYLSAFCSFGIFAAEGSGAYGKAAVALL